MPELNTGQEVLFLSPKEQTATTNSCLSRPSAATDSCFTRPLQKKVHVLQDHHHKQTAVSQDHHRVPASKDHQPVITGPSSNIKIDQLLQYLVAINGHNTPQQLLETQSMPATPATPSSTTSELPSTSSSSASTDCTIEEDTTTSDNESITLIVSDRQLRPCIPISYNETVLKCLHELPQIRTLNNISIPLPSDSSLKDTDTKDTDEENKHYT